MTSAVLAIAVSLVAAGAASPERCSQETLAIRGTPVSVSLCIVTETRAGDVTTLELEGTYGNKASAFKERSSLRFIAGEGPARALQSIDLSPLGITGTLHMTLLYSANEVSVEHALLTPGAVTIK